MTCAHAMPCSHVCITHLPIVINLLIIRVSVLCGVFLAGPFFLIQTLRSTLCVACSQLRRMVRSPAKHVISATVFKPYEVAGMGFFSMCLSLRSRLVMHKAGVIRTDESDTGIKS